jgi:hypothetical protein
MWANHPGIARRWTSEYGSFRGGSQAFKASPRSESGETWKKGTERVPRLPGSKRDFGGLNPSASARFKPVSRAFPNLKEADSEEGVTFVHGSGHRELGVPKPHKGLRGRDVRVAERKT